MRVTVGQLRRMIREVLEEQSGEGVTSLKIEVAPNEKHENSGWEYDQYKLVCNVKCTLNGEVINTTYTFFGITTDYHMLERDLLDDVLEEIGAGMDKEEFGEKTRTDDRSFWIEGIKDVEAIMGKEKEKQDEQESYSSY